MFPLKAIFTPVNTTTMSAKPPRSPLPVAKTSPPAADVSPSRAISRNDLKSRHATLVRIAARRREAAQDTDRPDRGEQGEVVPVHLIFQGPLAELIEPVEFERNRAPIGQDQAVETHGQARLVLVRHGPGRANHPRPSRHQDALPVRRVKRDGDYRQDRARKVAGELSDQDRFQKRAFMDALPSGGIFRPGESRRGRVIPCRGGIG